MKIIDGSEPYLKISLCDGIGSKEFHFDYEYGTFTMTLEEVKQMIELLHKLMNQRYN